MYISSKSISDPFGLLSLSFQAAFEPFQEAQGMSNMGGLFSSPGTQNPRGTFKVQFPMHSESTSGEAPLQRRRRLTGSRFPAQKAPHGRANSNTEGCAARVARSLQHQSLSDKSCKQGRVNGCPPQRVAAHAVPMCMSAGTTVRSKNFT